MSVVTIQRSPSPTAEIKQEDVVESNEDTQLDTSGNKSSSASEDFLAVKGAAVALPRGSRRRESILGNQGPLTTLEIHLRSIVDILRWTEKLKVMFALENVTSTPDDHHRYLCLISYGPMGFEEGVLLGVDITPQCTTIGMVLALLQDISIHPYGDGSLKVFNKKVEHFFKPVTVQTLWSAIQHVDQFIQIARRNNYYSGGLNHSWVPYYNSRVSSSRQHINEWHRTDDSEELSRSASPSRDGEEADERVRMEHEIRSKLREIMVSVDLEDVTVMDLRKRLAEKIEFDLIPYKKFIGDSVLFILGQLDSPTLIFDHLYLGSKWNACNLEELKENGVKYILNITREIENYFVDTMEYKNVKELDVETTDLLPYWEDTHRFINKARDHNSRILVHCKMGVSRSASTVMAYAMKEYGWSLEEAKQHVTKKRSCVYPNRGFMKQLELYEGMLIAKANRNKFNEDSKPIAPGGIIDAKSRFSPPGAQSDLVDEGEVPDQPIDVEQDIFQFKQNPPVSSVDMAFTEQITAHQSGKSSTQSSALSNRSIATDPMDDPSSPLGSGYSGCSGTDPRIADVRIVRPDIIESRTREEAPWRRSLRLKSEEKSIQINRCNTSPQAMDHETSESSQTNINRRWREDSSWIQSSESGADCQESSRPLSVPNSALSTDKPNFFLGGDIPGEESSTDPPLNPRVVSWPLCDQHATPPNLSPPEGLRPGIVQEQSQRLQCLNVGRCEEAVQSNEADTDDSGMKRSHSFSVYQSECIELPPGIVAKTRESIEARERSTSESEQKGTPAASNLLQVDDSTLRNFSDILWWFYEPGQISDTYMD